MIFREMTERHFHGAVLSNEPRAVTSPVPFSSYLAQSNRFAVFIF